jgi:hypothetical protein
MLYNLDYLASRNLSGSYRNLSILERYEIDRTVDHACRLFHTADFLEHYERKKWLQIKS